MPKKKKKNYNFIRFLPIKITKLKLCKIQKKKTKTGSNRPVSVRFSYFIFYFEVFLGLF
jgi:hypothetical protein